MRHCIAVFDVGELSGFEGVTAYGFSVCGDFGVFVNVNDYAALKVLILYRKRTVLCYFLYCDIVGFAQNKAVFVIS